MHLEAEKFRSFHTQYNIINLHHKLCRGWNLVLQHSDLCLLTAWCCWEWVCSTKPVSLAWCNQMSLSSWKSYKFQQTSAKTLPELLNCLGQRQERDPKLQVDCQKLSTPILRKCCFSQILRGIATALKGLLPANLFLLLLPLIERWKFVICYMCPGKLHYFHEFSLKKDRTFCGEIFLYVAFMGSVPHKTSGFVEEITNGHRPFHPKLLLNCYYSSYY